MEIKKDFLNKLNSCIWLKHCGEEVNNTFDFEIEFTSDEKDMIKSINSEQWENICLEKQGDLSAYLAVHHPNEYNKYWNEEVNIIKEKYFPLIIMEVSKVIQEKGLPQNIIEDIKFNLLTLFLANFYSDYYGDEFLENMLCIYLSGHLPCGWLGELENGKFIVY